MFDNVNINKAYTITDNITNNKVEVVNFNANIRVDSGVNTDININFPNLYKENLEEITNEFKQFQANVFSLAVSMGVMSDTVNISTVNSEYDSFSPITDILKTEARKIMDQIVDGLHDIKVNVTPTMERDIMRRY